MEARHLKAANSVVIGFRRVFGERISLSTFEDTEAARAALERAAGSDDAELKTIAAELAKALGLQIGAKSGAAAPAKPAAAPAKPAAPSPVTEAQWARLQDLGMKLAGPICMVFVSQAKDEGPANYDAAVELLADKLGAMGSEFRRAARDAK